MSYRRSMRRAVAIRLQKQKHQVEYNATGVNLSIALTSNVLVAGLDNPTIAATTSVQSRARVKGFYFELSMYSSAAAPNLQQYDWNFMASPQSAVVPVSPAATGSNTAKNYVFKSGHLIVGPSVSTPLKVYGFVKIPSKFQRFMNNDVIYWNVISKYNNGNTDNFGLKVIYKEIRG